MKAFFLLCATFGGTVMLAQFLLSLAGFGGGEHDQDGPSGMDGGDLHTGDMHAADGTHEQGTGEHQQSHHGSTWFFGIITFRTVIAALTFFGLAGLAAESADLEQPMSLLIAVGAGVAAMYGVYVLMRSLSRLNYEGTERIARAVGQEGVVYLSIPAASSGCGKVHVTLQNRLVEYEAMTNGERLPTGSRVVVVDILGTDRVRVEATPQTAESIHA